MRYNELMELFDSRSEWKTVSDTQNSKSFSFTINNVPFLVIFRRTSKFIKGKHIWFWSPSFDIQGRDEDDLYKLTGDGDSVAILSNVVDILRHVAKKEGNPNIIFTAEDADGVRSSLYRKMALTLTRGSEYKVVTEQEPGITVIMLLNAKTRQELNGEAIEEAPKKPTVSAKDAAMYVWDLLKRNPKGRRADFRDDTQAGARFSIPGDDPKDPNKYEISARHWGDWEIPQQAYDDGDVEDYDWEVISDESEAVLNQIIQDARSRYPDFNIRVQSGEKNWIYVEVTPK